MLALTASVAQATTAAELLAGYGRQSGQAPQAARGQQLFSQRHGGEWSCASCHGMPPSREGEHAATGRRIAPLAPAFNPRRFTDEAKVEKWFRRNCRDVLARECTSAEKADVLAWLMSVQP
nr:DUF1924 domain-containing protein [Azohydromonas caseinilytica]